MATKKGNGGLRQLTAASYAAILKFALKKKEPITQAEATKIGGWKTTAYHHLQKMVAADLLEYKGYNQWAVSPRALKKLKRQRLSR